MANEVEDPQHEIAKLRREIKHLDYILEKTFTFSDGHQPNCLAGMMCQCGFMHWHARQESKK
jgi:hypothetical protein